jgi:chemotaxis protein MotA
MDIATLLGILGAISVIIGAIFLGGDVIVFVNIPSIVVVLGGTIAVTLMRVSLKQFLGSFKVGLKAFFHKSSNPETVIEEAVELAKIARKEGMLALENTEINHPFLKKGIDLCIDGHAAEVVQDMLSKDINLTIERHEVGVQMFKSIGEAAPAMGMIGTLIGLVQMLSNMDDPRSIGPAMAVALLTTLYGAVIANAFALPIAEKLKLISREERLNKHLVLESISSLQAGVNPRVLEQLLLNFLPESKRQLTEQPA